MHIRWRGLELPSIVDCDRSTLTSNYGKFTAEPFEGGEEGSLLAADIGTCAATDLNVEPMAGSGGIVAEQTGLERLVDGVL